MNRSDVVFSVVGVIVICLLVFGYAATASRGPVAITEVIIEVTTYTRTNDRLQEPLFTIASWLGLAFLGFCAIGLMVLVGRGVLKGWGWWKHRASPTVNRIITIQLRVTNDSDPFGSSRERFRARVLECRRHHRLTKLLTWLNSGAPREVSLISVSESLDSSSS